MAVLKAPLSDKAGDRDGEREVESIYSKLRKEQRVGKRDVDDVVRRAQEYKLRKMHEEIDQEAEAQAQRRNERLEMGKLRAKHAESDVDADHNETKSSDKNDATADKNKTDADKNDAAADKNEAAAEKKPWWRFWG